jgi:hypothetical protein|nr:MAG: hypothetical protein [Bacteriophage sp.]DAN61175.1 MAG TPA: zipper dimerization domain transcription factor-like protein [Caudoviricetes sp.]
MIAHSETFYRPSEWAIFLYHISKGGLAMYGFNNQYQQGYGAPYMGQYGQASQQACQITRVNGRNGADAFRMAPNSSILLLDENDPVVWLKVSDGAGYCTVTPYSIAPYQDPAKVDVTSLEERVKRLEEMLNAKSDDSDAPAKRKKPE